MSLWVPMLTGILTHPAIPHKKLGYPSKPTAKGSDTSPLTTVSKEATQRHTSQMTPNEILKHSGIMPVGTTQLIFQVGKELIPPQIY
jgi:hypothetical protein